MAPFYRPVAWWEGTCRFSELKAHLFRDQVGRCETGVELFIRNSAFLVDSNKVLGLLGNGWLFLWLLRDVEEPCNGSNANEEVFVGDSLS